MRRSAVPAEPAVKLDQLGDARPFGRTPPIWIVAPRLQVVGLVGEDQVLHVADGNCLPVGEVDNGLTATGMKR